MKNKTNTQEEMVFNSPQQFQNLDCALPSATKILRDGQIYILRGDKTYTLQGQEKVLIQ